MKSQTVHGLHHFVVNALGTQIAHGELGVDAHIDIAFTGRQLRASTAAVREALWVLRAKGMVGTPHEHGARVLSDDSWNLLDEDVISWRGATASRADQFDELHQLRVSVEAAAAEACCLNATRADITALLAHCDHLLAAVDHRNSREFREAEMAFHGRLLAASGNQVFARLARPFRAAIQAQGDLDIQTESQWRRVALGHRELAEAIADRDRARTGRAAVALTEASCASAQMRAEDTNGVTDVADPPPSPTGPVGVGQS